MDHLFRVALYEGIWRIAAAATATAVLIMALATGAASALLIAAHVALLFAVLMVRNAHQLADMAKSLRRKAPESQRIADNRAAALTLGFAKAGSALAAGCAGLALMIAVSA